MKKVLRIIFYITLISTLLTQYSLPLLAQSVDKTIPVFVDGTPVSFDVQPVIRNDRTMVPFRAISEALNITVGWNGELRQVSATDGSNTVLLEIDNKTAYKNNLPITLDSPPIIVNDRTLIPLRFFSEAFGCKVMWFGDTSTVKILSPKKEMQVFGFYALGDNETSSWKSLFKKPFPENSPGNTDVIGVASLGWYSLDEKGTLLTRSRTGWERPDGWDKVLDTLKIYGLKSEMVIHMADGDSSISKLIADETSARAAVKAISTEASLYGGVNLDLEGLGWQESDEKLAATRKAFTHFTELLYNEMHKNNKNLTLTLHPLNSAYPGYNYEDLGKVSDQIIVMAYDYGVKPEPADLVQEAVEMAVQLVPADKIVLGISVPNETAESILTKIGIAKKYNLKGIALWRLGLIPQDIWDALRESVYPIK